MTGHMAEIVVYGALLLVYLIPTIVATIRRRPNVAGIAMFNILAGWTVVGWVLPLLWSLMSERRVPTNGPPLTQSDWRSPVEYVPAARRKHAPLSAPMDIAKPQKSRFVDASAEAQAAYQAAKSRGGDAWS